MGKLCIHLCASYSAEPKWTREIEDDSTTVKETLSDHTIIDIFFPVKANGKYDVSVIQKLASEGLKDIDSSLWEECHIVINTHGRAGASDISNELIKLIIIKLSEVNIKLTQISALQCNGFKRETESEYRKRFPMMPAHQKFVPKPAALDGLAKSLKKIKTKIPQTFKVLGFGKPYDPKSDKSDVVNLLRGHADEFTLVSIDGEATQQYYNAIQEHIDTCRKRDCSTHEAKTNYEMAGNELAKVLQKINENINHYLCGKARLNPSSVALFESVKSFADWKDTPSARVFYDAYQQWKKVYKSYDEERLNVLTAYCEINTHIELEHEAISPQHQQRVFEWDPSHERKMVLFSKNKELSPPPLPLAHELGVSVYNVHAFFSQKSSVYTVESKYVARPGGGYAGNLISIDSRRY